MSLMLFFLYRGRLSAQKEIKAKANYLEESMNSRVDSMRYQLTRRGFMAFDWSDQPKIVFLHKNKCQEPSDELLQM